MKDIFYKPNLRPEKDYMSDAEIEESLSEILEDQPEEEFSRDLGADIEDAIKDLEKILEVSSIIPEKEREIVEAPLRLIIDEMRKIRGPEEDDLGDLPEPPEETSPPIDMDAPSLFPDDIGIPIRTKNPIPITLQIRDTYAEDLIDIYKDFVIKLRKIIENYIRDILYITEIGGFKSYKDLFYEYGISSSEIPEGIRHLGDKIIRSQIERDQKSRMLRKLYNVDHTIYHLRASKSSCELRERYYGEQYRKESDYLEAEANRSLRKNRLSYDKKYFDSMKNFYKYLDSSSILVEDMLKAFSEEAKAKAVLAKEGIDIKKHATEEEALREKEIKIIEKDYKESKESYEEEEKTRIEGLKSAGKNPNGIPERESQEYAGYTPVTGENLIGGDGNIAIANVAMRWARERGVNSSNPVIYSMGKRSSDMDLKKYGDCSSFTRKVCLEAGVGEIGYNTKSQLEKKVGQFIERLSDIKTGDIMYFKQPKNSTHGLRTTLPNGKVVSSNHTGIYIGNSKFVHLSYGRGGITTEDFGNNAWYKTYVQTEFIGAIRHK